LSFDALKTFRRWGQTLGREFVIATFVRRVYLGYVTAQVGSIRERIGSKRLLRWTAIYSDSGAGGQPSQGEDAPRSLPYIQGVQSLSEVRHGQFASLRLTLKVYHPCRLKEIFRIQKGEGESLCMCETSDERASKPRVLQDVA
jgi:hypothetical protein